MVLINHLDLNTVHLVGTSMGSFTSVDFALNHSDRVHSVTLIGNSSGLRDEQEQAGYRQNWVGDEIRLCETDGAGGAVAVLEKELTYQSFQKNDSDGWAIYAGNLRGQSVTGAIHILSTLHWDRRSLFDDELRLKALDSRFYW